MITVGMLFREIPSRKNGVFMSYLYMARAWDIELFFYSMDGTDFDNNTVNGKFFENGKIVYRSVPIPKLTDNHISPNRRDAVEFYDKLTKISFCPRNRMSLNKFQQSKQCRLNPDPRYIDYVIPSISVNNVQQLSDSFNVLDTDVIILKSAFGMEGRGIVKIAKSDGKYIVNEDGKITGMTPAEYRAYFETHIPKHGFTQPCINSYAQSEGGAPFDVRVKVQRRNGTDYTATMYPRISGRKDSITSNIHQGGFTVPLEYFLNREYGSEAGTVKNSLNTFANGFPGYFQQFMDKPFFDLGIDVGIDRRPDSGSSCGHTFHPVVFEVNAFPGSTGYLGERTGVDNAMATFEYYHYLWNRHIDEKHPDFVGLTDEDRVVK